MILILHRWHIYTNHNMFVKLFFHTYSAGAGNGGQQEGEEGKETYVCFKIGAEVLWIIRTGKHRHSNEYSNDVTLRISISVFI